MNTVLLRSFVEVARLESYTRAAAALGLSQPAVYQHVSALQGSLNVALVEMRGKRVVLTAEGKAILPHALRVIAAEAELVDTLPTKVGSLRGGVIDLLSGFTLGQSVLPGAVARLKAHHPEVQVRCRTMRSTREMDEALLSHSYDAAVHSGRHIAPGLVRIELMADEVLLVTRPEASAQRLGPSGKPRHEGFVAYGSPSELKSSIESWVGQQEFQVPINVEFDTQQAILGAVLAGYGTGALNRSLCRRYIEDGSLVSARFDPPVTKTYSLVHRANASLGPALRKLIELIRDSDT